jgi:hypothetical protein
MHFVTLSLTPYRRYFNYACRCDHADTSIGSGGGGSSSSNGASSNGSIDGSSSSNRGCGNCNDVAALVPVLLVLETNSRVQMRVFHKTAPLFQI